MSPESDRGIEWSAAFRGGLAYVVIVFCIGFVFGTLRVLLLVPAIGNTLAVVAEVPIMLAASWLVSGWCTRRFAVRDALGTRTAMGAVAFAALMCIEFGFAVVLYGDSLMRYLAKFATLPGAIGLATQLLFATIPALQASRDRRRSAREASP